MKISVLIIYFCLIIFKLAKSEDNNEDAQLINIDEDDFSFLRIATATFMNGEYYGQSMSSFGSPQEVPHGIGSYITKDGFVKYSGKWFKGYMHGIGNLYFDDGRNYSGKFYFNQMHGYGRMIWPSGQEYRGEFSHNRMSGQGLMIYPNGDERIGTIKNDLWIGEVDYIENSKGTNNKWKENWINGTFLSSVKIFKEIKNNYSNIGVKVICKVHVQKLSQLRLYKEQKLLKELNSISSKKNTWNYEISYDLSYSNDDFKLFTCRHKDKNGIITEDRIHIQNPFFLESYAECGHQIANSFPDNKNSMLSKIIGGKKAAIGEVPWQAILQLRVKELNISYDMFCGGSIISPWHILTAAHCLRSFELNRNVKPQELVIRVGFNNLSQLNSSQKLLVNKIYVHPLYDNKTYQNDIAILSLTQKIIINEYSNPVCLPQHHHFNKITENNQRLILSGYGLAMNLFSEKLEFPESLNVAQIRYLNISKCFSSKPNISKEFSGYFCAGGGLKYGTLQPDSCRGDSGSPVTFKDKTNDRYYLMGIVSFGPKHCGYSPGGVYVNVSYYTQWIHSVRLLDLVEEYQNNNYELSYEKIDGDIFKTMMNFLSQWKTKIIK